VFRVVSKLKDDVTLDTLKRSQIQAMCKFLDISSIGPTEYLRFALEHKIDKLCKDDLMIKEEGLNSLTLLELKQAVAARGMHSMGSRKVLESLMEEWLDLSLNQKVPIAMLILSRAFRLVSDQSSDELLRESIVHLPPGVLHHTEQSSTANHSEQTTTTTKKAVPSPVGSVEELPEVTQLLDKVEKISDAVYESVAPQDFRKEKIEALKRNVQDLLQLKDKKLADLLVKMIDKLEKEVTTSKSSPALDLDNDGLLSCQELSIFLKTQLKLPEVEVKNFMAKLDPDEDGYVKVEHVKNLRDLVVNEAVIRDFVLSQTSSGETSDKVQAHPQQQQQQTQ